MGGCSLLPHILIYSTICFYQYDLINVYFILWVIIWYYFIFFVAQIVLVLAIKSSFSWLLCPWYTPIIVAWVILCHYNYFSSSCAFLALVFKSAIFQRKLESFLFVFFFWDKISLYSPGWPQNMSLLPQPLGCWDKRLVPPHPPWILLLENGFRNQDVATRCDLLELKYPCF
jgi:hypothetical protein